MTKAKCGTISGYATHRAKKEIICEDCRNVHSAYMREYRQKNKEKMTELRKSWAERNPEKMLESSRKYRRNNLEKRRQLDIRNKHRRRARTLNNGFEIYTEKQIIDLYGIICYLCNLEIDMKAPRSCKEKGWELGLQIDHVVPIAKGGGDTLDNVRPSHGICNIRKGSKN